MEDELELIFPSKEYKEQIEEFKEEFIQNNENNIPGGGGLEREETFEDWMQKINDDLSEEKSKARGRVPSVLYLAFRKRDKKLIGIIQIRYALNEYLYNFGGHIGDSIRPSERNKGYSTKMIALALKEAKKLSIGNVLMTCNKNNLASARTIIKNGGKLEISGSMKDIIVLLDNSFFMAHKSCIINLDKIHSIDPINNIITFKNNIKIDKLSSRNKKELVERINSYE